MPALFTNPCSPPNFSAAFTAVSQSLLLGYIVPYERCSMTQFRRKLLALRLDHIANNNSRSFGDEQASLGLALTACSSTDEYDFPFETIHLSSIAVRDHADRGGVPCQ
jgi:hypothetical protein